MAEDFASGVLDLLAAILDGAFLLNTGDAAAPCTGDAALGTDECEARTGAAEAELLLATGELEVEGLAPSDCVACAACKRSSRFNRIW